MLCYFSWAQFLWDLLFPSIFTENLKVFNNNPLSPHPIHLYQAIMKKSLYSSMQSNINLIPGSVSLISAWNNILRNFALGIALEILFTQWGENNFIFDLHFLWKGFQMSDGASFVSCLNKFLFFAKNCHPDCHLAAKSTN